MENQILVLSVDRDNDVGDKASVVTPVIGREECLKAAVSLSLADPEEADANAIMGAIKEYDDLISSGRSCQVAVVAGQSRGGVAADEKIRAEVSQIKEKIGFSEIMLVSDGMEDELVMPILLSIAPIISVKRVIIKHSKSVEESYIVLGKYIRMALYDPRYSRIFLGIPGSIFLLYAIMYFTPYRDLAPYLILLVIGAAFIVRGFDLDNYVSRAKNSPFSLTKFFGIVSSALLIVIGVIVTASAVGGTPVYQQLISNGFTNYTAIEYLTGFAIVKFAPYLWIALAIDIFVNAFYHSIRRSALLVKDLTILVSLGLFYLPLLDLATVFMNPKEAILPPIIIILSGIAVITIVGYVGYSIYIGRRASGHESPNLHDRKRHD
ncbi:MAG: DUF373 family protein [Nitrososphaerota archaeon]|nr:DUF373 family protein [Nitrososphaerota archaeon]MDG7037753.1 DUF373 family protein [Nitrososphaerota archaeon]MDG7042537.1 DUF373 family protein [Nitrososphaerota archaeon]